MAAGSSPLPKSLGCKALGYIGATLALAAGVASLAAFGAVRAQEKGYGQTIGSPQQERELDYGTGTNRSGSLFDSANPIDLMNKLRRATAMDDATTPRDALDAALRDYESPPAAPASASPAAGVKGP
ncbi:MAG: hypothetical protein O2839_08410 [Cyanobacteria bacterium]|nr:hypothetical protein [Cyanobacteriota bacterium]MDA1245986.1 hypothetical protein [Cyanobacteriota bacterium]